MSEAVINRVRKGFYLDSVALMRLSREITGRPGIAEASLMIGTPANRQILEEAGLLAETGRAAGANDLILAVRAESEQAGTAALDAAEASLDSGSRTAAAGGAWRPRGLGGALDVQPGSNLVLVSVPGDFAALEARRALLRGLNVLMFSDNVPIADEIALKRLAAERGLLMMGPDCGTALIGGAALAFTNVVPRGNIGLVAASGTGLQEVTCLIARGGGGVSHGIGVGGRDLYAAVGGIMTLAAIDALERDAATRHIVLISKPPAAEVADRVLDRVANARKPFTVCFMGAEPMAMPINARQAFTLAEAARLALGRNAAEAAVPVSANAANGRRGILGLYSGGTLCAEAQVVLRRAGETVRSNAPVPGAGKADAATGHLLLDLGADEYTRGRPHPMIDPTVRDDLLSRALADGALAVILVDVVIGYGAHTDPAGALSATVMAAPASRPAVVASVCGTDGDPQNYTVQVAKLKAAGIVVADSNASAAATAFALSGSH